MQYFGAELEVFAYKKCYVCFLNFFKLFFFNDTHSFKMFYWYRVIIITIDFTQTEIVGCKQNILL